MVKPRLSELEKILNELILPFYAISRATPLPKKFGRNENDAEHSWGLALMACAIAPRISPKLDVGLICQFAVIHDLVEVYAGDTPNFASDAELLSKDDREHAALEKIEKDFSNLPWIAEIIRKYEKQDTPEAKFVRSLDKTLALMQEYASEGQIFHNYKITRNQFRSKIANVRNKASGHSTLFEYYLAAEQKLLDNPDFFYQADKK